MSSRNLDCDKPLLAQAYNSPVDASSGHRQNHRTSAPNEGAVNVPKQSAHAPHDARNVSRDPEEEPQKSEYGGGPPPRHLGPWYKTRKGKIAIFIVVFIIVAAVVAGAVGGTLTKTTDEGEDSNAISWAPVQSVTPIGTGGAIPTPSTSTPPGSPTAFNGTFNGTGAKRSK